MADDPTSRLSPRLAAMEGGYRGHDGLRRWSGHLFAALPDYTVEVLELRDLGDACSSHRALTVMARRAASTVMDRVGSAYDDGATGKFVVVALLRDRGRGPQSRGAGGVGDVAGERGDGAQRIAALESRDADLRLALCRDPEVEWFACGSRGAGERRLSRPRRAWRAASRRCGETWDAFDARRERGTSTSEIACCGSGTSACAGSASGVELDAGARGHVVSARRQDHPSPTSSLDAQRPSKPWGWRSRRCRRRTWRSFDVSMTRSSTAVWIRLSNCGTQRGNGYRRWPGLSRRRSIEAADTGRYWDDLFESFSESASR